MKQIKFISIVFAILFGCLYSANASQTSSTDLCEDKMEDSEECAKDYRWAGTIGAFTIDLTFSVRNPFEKSTITGGVYYAGQKIGKTSSYWRSSKGYLRVEFTGFYHGIKFYFNPSRRTINYKIGKQNMLTYKWSWPKSSEFLTRF